MTSAGTYVPELKQFYGGDTVVGQTVARAGVHIAIMQCMIRILQPGGFVCICMYVHAGLGY